MASGESSESLPDPALIVEGQVRGRGTVPIQFIHHALRRMRQRGITQEQALTALRIPDVTGLEADEGREHYRRHLTASTAIDVVFDNLPDRVRVISVFRFSIGASRR